MSEHLGVSGSWAPSELKRELLFFDKIVMIDPHTIRSINDNPYREGYKADFASLVGSESANFDYLMNVGCLVDSKEYGFDFSHDSASKLIESIDADAGKHYRILRESARNRKLSSAEDFVDSVQKFLRVRATIGDYLSVYLAEQLRQKDLNAASLSRRFDSGDLDDGNLTKNREYLSVSKVILEKIPVPCSEVPFEQILDFRADEDARGYLFGLRHWMNKAAKLDQTSNELSDEIEWLKHKHSERLAKHKIESEHSVISSIFISTFEIAEQTIKLQWGQAAKGVISLVGKRQKNLGFEVDPEGAEINFLIKADAQFSKP